MKVNVEEISPIERKLSVEVESSKVAEELDRAYSQVGRQVKIPGFRPGKIPRRILEQRFKAEVESDVIQRVVQQAYIEAIEQKGVEPVASPQVTNGALRPDAPFSFEARVEVKPKVEPKDYQGLGLKRAEVSVELSKVDERIEQLRQASSHLEPVSGRNTAQSGDFATIDYEATADGKPFPGSKAENVTVEVAPGELVYSKIAALEGTQVGQAKEIDYAFPPDYGVAEVKGKVGRFKIQLKALKTKVIPELNDDFAKEAGKGQTVDELKRRVKEELEAAQRSSAALAERDQILDLLIQKNPFQVPKAMIDRALDSMLEGALRMLLGSGVDPQQLQLDIGQLREQMREKAVREVKGMLLLEAIAQKEGISVSPSEVDQKIEAMAEEAKQGVAQLRKYFKDPRRRQGLTERLREEKTVEFLKANATYS